MVALDSNRWLLNSFVHWVTGQNMRKQKLVVFEQSLPGDEEDLWEEEAQRRGIEDVNLLLITVHAVPGRLPDKVIVKQWWEVYAWLSKHAAPSIWARRCLEYIQVAETQEAEAGYLQEGRLTVFSGIPFGRDEPYSYGQAKRLLKLLREELCRDERLIKQLGADLIAPGRPAITGRERSSVWDFIPITHA